MDTRGLLNEMSDEAGRVLVKVESVLADDVGRDPLAPNVTDVLTDVLTYFSWVRQSVVALMLEGGDDAS